MVLFGALPKEIAMFHNPEKNLNFISFFQLLYTVCYYNHLANKLLLKNGFFRRGNMFVMIQIINMPFKYL